MQQQGASFWADIKDLEERLAQDPDSYLFARLSDVYLKVNLVDDALHTARQGVAKFPAYIAGQRALAMACHAKGLMEECCQALQAVTAALPENAESQKMLAGLLLNRGDREAAKKVFHVIQDFYPEDAECREELEALEKPASLPLEGAGMVVVDETEAGLQQPVEEIRAEADEIIDLTEDDIWVEEAEFLAGVSAEVPAETLAEAPAEALADVPAEPIAEASVPVAPVQHDPLSTATLADLYVQQGFTSKALEIYRALLNEDPTNADMLSRIAELEAKELAPAVGDSVPEEREIAPAIALQASSVLSDVPAQGRADEVIATLEGWLDTIRRIKACR